jgi:hypothetical protein
MLKVSTMSIFFRLLRQSKKIKLNNRIKRNKSTMKLRIRMLSRLILRLRRKSRLLLDIGIRLKNWLRQRLKSRLNRQSRLRKKRLSMPRLKRLSMPRLKRLTIPRLKSPSRLRLRSQSTPRRILLKKLSQKNKKLPSNRLRSK